ncbi:hypothetical protein NMD14_02855 [Aeromonas veronii]
MKLKRIDEESSSLEAKIKGRVIGNIANRLGLQKLIGSVGNKIGGLIR